MSWRRRDPAGAATAAALAAWTLLLAVAVVWGRQLPTSELSVRSPPFQGDYRFAPFAVLPAATFAAAAVFALPLLARRLRWGPLLACSTVLATVWIVLLNAWEGHDSLVSVVERAHEYLPAVANVGDDPSSFLSTFADDVAHERLPLHVTGHPPLMVLVLWLLDRVGLSGPWPATVLIVGVGASSVAAVVVVLRALGAEPAARRALPFLVLAPFALTVMTSTDAFFLGVAAWAAAATAVGLRGASPCMLLVAGVLTGALPYLSYGLLPFGAVLAAVAVLAARRLGRPARGTGAWLAASWLVGVLALPVLLTLGGFWWPDGVAATHLVWSQGRGSERPYLYSVVGDFAVLGVLVGPATAVAAARRPRGVPTVLAGAALLGLVALATAGVTRLEVERIWLPWAPWLVVLTAALGPARGWLALNVATALTVQTLVFGFW